MRASSDCKRLTKHENEDAQGIIARSENVCDRPDLGLSVVIVTHDLAVARLLSHRIMVMKDGHIVEQGLTDRVLDDPQAPYTQLLVSSILQV